MSNKIPRLCECKETILFDEKIVNIKALYVASFRYVLQVAPDDYEMKTHTMVCNSDTTLKEIHEWRKREIRNPKDNIEILITQATS